MVPKNRVQFGRVIEKRPIKNRERFIFISRNQQLFLPSKLIDGSPRPNEAGDGASIAGRVMVGNAYTDAPTRKTE